PSTRERVQLGVGVAANVPGIHLRKLGYPSHPLLAGTCSPPPVGEETHVAPIHCPAGRCLRASTAPRPPAHAVATLLPGRTRLTKTLARMRFRREMANACESRNEVRIPVTPGRPRCAPVRRSCRP